MSDRRGSRGRRAAHGWWGVLALSLTSCSNRDSAPLYTETPVDSTAPSNINPGSEDRMPDPAAPPITLIPPGAVIAEQAGEGWTHLLIKSKPEAGLGDVDKLSDSLKSLSSLFFTAMLARVRPDASGDRS